MGMAQAFAAVSQVQAHGRTSRFGILAGNGLVDFFVLAVQSVMYCCWSSWARRAEFSRVRGMMLVPRWVMMSVK